MKMTLSEIREYKKNCPVCGRIQKYCHKSHLKTAMVAEECKKNADLIRFQNLKQNITDERNFPPSVKYT